MIENRPSDAAASLSSHRLVHVVSPPRLSRLGDGVIGALRKTSEVRGALALKPRDPAALSSFLATVVDPRSPGYHDYLRKGAFARRFGPSRSTVATVRAALQGDGLTVTSVAANRLLVSFEGTANAVESTFHTGLVRVGLGGGEVGRATSGPVRLPAAIAGDVESVIGLDNLVSERATPESSRLSGHAVAASASAGAGGPVACAVAKDLAQEGGLTDEEVASAYGLDPLYDSGDLAAGQTIDVYELEPFSMSDVRQFDACYFGTRAASSHAARVSVSRVDGGPGSGYGSGEAALDVENVSALAPDARIHVFSGPNALAGYGALDTWNSIVVADDARQITTSWGICETALQAGSPGFQEAENDIFEQAAAQGQTVFAASGDDGSDDCASHASTPTATDLSVDDPGSQPYVVSVGGTTMTDASTPPVETVWNNGALGGAGGGGVSETWAMPSWQSGSVAAAEAANEACSDDPSGSADEEHLAGYATTLSAGTPCREVPDVSAVADPQSGITIVWSGFWLVIGGTSSAAPLWAAMTAEMNASTSCGGGADDLGFLSPLLYTVSGGPAYSSAFNNITKGNNDNLDVGDGDDYPATVGYNLASGLGTPKVTNRDGDGLVNQLCALVAKPAPRPVVTSLSSDAGPLEGGAAVTISGTGFGVKAGKVYFGDVPASITSWSATAISLDVPPASPPLGTPSGAGAISAVVTVSTAASLGPVESSSPSTRTVYHYTGGSSGSSPVVDYLSSSAGPTAGGNTLDVIGSGFEEGGGVDAVTFGGAKGTVIKVVSDDEVEVTVPAESAGVTCATSASGLCQSEVVLTNADGASSTTLPILPPYTGALNYSAAGNLTLPVGCGCEAVPAPTEYDFAPPPSISSVSPAYASELGGNTVQINGSGFSLLDIDWVTIGPANENLSQDLDVTSLTPTIIDLVTTPDEYLDVPTGPSVPTALSVATAGGRATAPSFAYAGIPRVTGLSEHYGNQASPRPLTIRGQNLEDADMVVFVGQGELDGLYSSTTTFSLSRSGDSITVDPPSFFAVPTDVLVCSVTGCDNPDPAVDSYVFVYAGRPVLTSAAPRQGPEHGGTLVVLNGELDSNIVSVDFGNRAATIVEAPFASPSGAVEVFTPPSRTPGTVPITITTLGGKLVGSPTSVRKARVSFTYRPSTPSAPRAVVVRAAPHALVVSWLPPYADGGSPVTGYVVHVSARNHRPISVMTKLRHATIRHLTPGVLYVAQVAARSARGTGLVRFSRKLKPKG